MKQVRFSILLVLATAFTLLITGCGNKDEASSGTAAPAGKSVAAAAPQSGGTPYPGMQGAKLVVPGDKEKK